VVAGAVVSAGRVVSLGSVVGASVVVSPATVVGVVRVVSFVVVDPESRFGRRNQISAAVTTITASDARMAIVTSRRSRGGFHPDPRFDLFRWGLIVS
jgi:hypothetical protein